MEFNFLNWLAHTKDAQYKPLRQALISLKPTSAQELYSALGDPYKKVLAAAHYRWQYMALCDYSQKVISHFHPSHPKKSWVFKKDDKVTFFHVWPIFYTEVPRNVGIILVQQQDLFQEEEFRRFWEDLVTANPEIRRLAPLHDILLVQMNRGAIAFAMLKQNGGNQIFSLEVFPEEPPFYTSEYPLELFDTPDEFFSALNLIAKTAYNGHPYSYEFEEVDPNGYQLKHAKIDNIGQNHFETKAEAIKQIIEFLTFYKSTNGDIQPFSLWPIQVIARSTGETVWTSSYITDS